MKYIYIVIFGLISFFGIAQESNGEYVKVILDGKEVYMSTKTGEIKGAPVSKNNTTVKEVVSSTKEIAGSTIHKVEKGETLYSISRKYGMTVAKLQDANNITGTNLAIGQELQVFSIASKASKASVSSGTYTVQKGDTLYAISRKYNMSVSELKELNNLSSSHLSIGQVLNIK